MARLRTFLAIELSEAIRDQLTALQEKLAEAAAGVKWVEPENLHLTLLFLGEVEDRDLPKVCRAAQAAVADVPRFTLAVEGAGCFPNPRRPRVLWVGVGAGRDEVVAVHDALEVPLLELGCYRREERQYTPHVTLGRLKGDRPADQLGPALQKYQGWKAGECAAHEVLVMSSQLTPRGPLYTVLGRAKFA